MELASLGQQCGSRAIESAIIEFARRRYPSNRGLRRIQLSQFAHSEDARERQMAREEMLKDLRIETGPKGITIPDNIEDPGLLGIMLDAYEQDDMSQEALKITSSLVEKFPTNGVFYRNHAKFLGLVGRREECLDWHRRTIFLEDVDDTSIVWFGNELNNTNRHVDAMEVYLLACLTDPMDSLNFAHVVNQMSIALREAPISAEKKKKPRALPEEFSVRDVVLGIQMALSCQWTSQRAAEFIDRTVGRLGNKINTEELRPGKFEPCSTEERIFQARLWYDLLRSPLTTPEPHSVPLVPA
jgi:hypothetical protein